jgi:predicted HTH domain antitoxin
MKMDFIYPKKGIESLIRLNIYKDEKSLMEDAFRALLELKPSLRIEYAVDIYKNREVSLWSAAEKAGLSLEEFKEVLAGRGVKIEVSSSREESDRRIKKVFNA